MAEDRTYVTISQTGRSGRLGLRSTKGFSFGLFFLGPFICLFSLGKLFEAEPFGSRLALTPLQEAEFFLVAIDLIL